MVEQKLFCAYCEHAVLISELAVVDCRMKSIAEIDPEFYEFILDQLGETLSNGSAFVHRPSDLPYDVINVCINCFRQAEARVHMEEETDG